MKRSSLDLLIAVCEKPSMYVQGGTYEAVCGYLDGFDAAIGELSGFRKWLLVRGREWSTLPWWAVLRKQVLPESGPARPLTPEENKLLLRELADALRGFRDIREGGGLETVFQLYFAWLLSTSDPSSEPLREELRRDFGIRAKSPI